MFKGTEQRMVISTNVSTLEPIVFIEIPGGNMAQVTCWEDIEMQIKRFRDNNCCRDFNDEEVKYLKKCAEELKKICLKNDAGFKLCLKGHVFKIHLTNSEGGLLTISTNVLPNYKFSITSRSYLDINKNYVIMHNFYDWEDVISEVITEGKLEA